MGQPKDNLAGQMFGNWLVLSYAGSSKWLCECQCELKTRRNVRTMMLKNGTSKSCGCNHTGKLVGEHLWDWDVLKYIGDGNYLCRCSCGKEKIVSNTNLRSGAKRTCGHNNSLAKLDDLKGKQFNRWLVLEYSGNHKWKCQCQCKNKTIRDVLAEHLKNGASKSCGCLQKENNLIKYGDISANKRNNPRENWQIEVVSSAENLKQFINGLQYKPTLLELSNLLNITSVAISRKLYKFELTEFVDYNPFRSYGEKELYNYITDIYKGVVIKNSNDILDNLELDIYIPELKLALEFNGTYWHSTEQKGKYYHQHKTIECIKNGIRLIHIFEYEWLDKNKQNKLKNYLKHIICSEQSLKFYARDLDIKLVNTQDKEKFENKYHLQSSTNSKIAIGLYNNTELLGLMTFGHPRFNNNFEYELIRLCYKTNVNIVGGTERMFKYFIDNYTPTSIVSYCDLAKFDGNTYFKLGFEANKDCLTSPNYIWVDTNSNKVLPRYKTQKHKLLEAGLGELGNTEDEIMKNLNYLKIYDSGNMRFEWKN